LTTRALLAAALLALAGCSSEPPAAIPAEGSALDASPLARFVHHQGEAREMAFTPDGRMLIAAGTDGRIELMRGATGAVWRTIEHPGGASPVALSPDGTMLVSGGYDGTARIWASPTSARFASSPARAARSGPSPGRPTAEASPPPAKTG
jgi:WD40 repeat protein